MSEWKQDAAARRDLRATKTDGIPRRPRAKKDTRKWCRGKAGVEHITRPVVTFEGQPWWPKTYGHDECVTCGKHVKDWTREARTGGTETAAVS